MKDSTDATEKTSRRRFTKTVASALVAMPVISSLSSCAQKPPTPGQPPATPSPQPSGTPGVEFERGINPPVIIDGGSLSISLDTRLEQDDTNESPRPWKHTQQDRVYGAITAVRLMNEVGDPLRPSQPDFPVGLSDSLELKISLQTAGPENGAGVVTYDPLPTEPQFLLTNTGEGRTFEIRYVEKIDNPDKLHKRTRPHKKYRRDKLKTGHLTSKVFRIGKVQIIVGATNFEAGESVADNGFRIVVFMRDPS